MNINFLKALFAILGIVLSIAWYLNPTGKIEPILTFLAALLALFAMVFDHKNKNKEPRRHIDKRIKLYQELSSKKYQKWQLSVLKYIYKDLNFVELYGKTYTASIIRPSFKFKYPFNSLCKLDSTVLQELVVNKEQKEYFAFLGKTIKRPEMSGFSLKKIDVDKYGDIKKIHAIASNYKQNVITAHIAEWELFQLYKKNPNISIENTLEQLKHRKIYHGKNLPSQALLEPSNAFPLISVQAMLVFKDYKFPEKHEWKIVVAQRNENVAVRPGLWQFQPSGGFEVFGREDDDKEELLKQGFDIRMAMLREYAEELFNVDEFQYRSDSRDADSILLEPNIVRLTNLINNKKASMEFLGVTIELALMRHEVSFLIVVDDKDYSLHGFTGSWEAKSIIPLTPKEVKKTFMEGQIHSSSAALLKLARESETLKKIGVSKQLF